MAESFNVGVNPHNPLTPISTAACIQIDACIPNFVLQEYTGKDKPPKSEMVKEPLRLEKGYLTRSIGSAWIYTIFARQY